ncbi:phospholipid/cholesterol/gamma-HCH transport system substrate-binding protein [Rhodococcus sp. 27YEA15]|uniref:MCE family protein n=1 Tax=Rhodococcus sp. 27YEA15 TaxID=3156259 RepID=UPI003C7ACCE6
MILSTFVKFQLVVFTLLTVTAVGAMAIFYMRIPSMVGIGRYTLSVELPTTGGLYKTGNVSYRGATVGRVAGVDLREGGVIATLDMDSAVKIPVAARAEVHSRSAIGEQYVDLVADIAEGPYFGNGDVVPESRSSVPQDIAPLLDTVSASLEAIPEDKLRDLLDEGYAAFNGTGRDIGRILDSASTLTTGALDTRQEIVDLVVDAEPVLRSQQQSSAAIAGWARNVATLAGEYRIGDPALRGILDVAPSAAREMTAMFQSLSPTVPLLLANLTSLGQVGVTYNASLEQVLVILPQAMSMLTTIGTPNRADDGRAYLSFNLNLNNQQPCTTGFLPASERRGGAALDSPTRTADPIYCALPQDSQIDVRGARNLPCMDTPGKRAPTVVMCKSDEQYQPKGTNPWIGNPTPTFDNPLADEANRMFTPPPSPPSTRQVAVADSTSSDGRYTGDDGNSYVLQDPVSAGVRSWQDLIGGR